MKDAGFSLDEILHIMDENSINRNIIQLLEEKACMLDLLSAEKEGEKEPGFSVISAVPSISESCYLGRVEM